ncbi:hypothetical protein BpHYR1_002285 [Brachionus plicatilis]|uniref:Uncharacterized protein n=1 Tax=Brachionus plicatilis TaxID=10195 RepID=A0A3M7SQU1_BRAPC|nr:hypothetical protein BpHYR1_002285 [Brachionus plicatilis]
MSSILKGFMQSLYPNQELHHVYTVEIKFTKGDIYCGLFELAQAYELSLKRDPAKPPSILKAFLN